MNKHMEFHTSGNIKKMIEINVSRLLIKRIGLMFIVFFSLFGKILGQIPYTSSGLYSIPAGVTQIKVECWGAGGGGSTITSNGARGGGGGGGAYASSIVTVVPGNIYSIVVGTGGTANNTGGNSSFNTSDVIAAGGNGGTNNSATAGSGGSTAASIGVIEYAGGNGANGGGTWSGGGGGGAGSNGAGGNAPTAASGSFGTGTSLNGGNGGASIRNSNNGNNGNNYGAGGSGASTNSGTARTGGSGANGYVLISLPANVLLASPNTIAAGNLYQASVKQPLAGFSTTITTTNAKINSITFTTSGTYLTTDILNFQLWYNTSNDLNTATQISSIAASGIGSHSFSGLSQITNMGSTGYFWITTDIASIASIGGTISVNAISSTDLIYEIANITGSATAGGIQTIVVTSQIAISSPNLAIAAANVNQGAVDQLIYSFSTDVSLLNATLNSVSFTTTGTYTVRMPPGAQSDDITKFKLWYNTSNVFSSATQIGSNIISSLGTGSHTFSNLNLTTNSGSTGYFWITANIGNSPTNSRTIAVNALNSANLNYSQGVKTVTTYAGGTQTIQVVSGILLTSTHPAVSASNVLKGDLKKQIYKYTTMVSGSNATINSVSFTTSGSYLASDISNFKLWYSTVNSLVDASTILIGTISTSLGSGSHIFTGLSTTTAAGGIGYFWITADIASGASTNNTLYVQAITTTSLTYASGTKLGTAYDGGIITIQPSVDSDGDGIPDLYDLDDDNDGIPDTDENAPCNSATVELFPNGNFNGGNIGFLTAYHDSTGLVPEGNYHVTNNPNSVHGSFASCGDHTSGSGNMMVVNGDPVMNKIVWSSGLITVTPNTDYTLSLYLTSVTTSFPAQLIWNVNGENLGTQFNATATNCAWVYAEAKWNSGTQTSATFDIVNLNLNLGGNDFALDDISCKAKTNCDADGDGTPDKLDLDSDNDGIYDIVEANSSATNYDTNNDGIIDSYTTDVDKDGLADAVDNVNSGLGGSEVTNGTPLTNSDTDTDGLSNRIDLDSDNDGCYDTKEAGFTDTGNFTLCIN